MAQDTSVRVFLVADDAGRSSVDAALEAARDIEIIGHSPDIDEAENQMRRTGAHVAVIDVRNHERGVELCREIRSRVPDVLCVVVSGFHGDEAKVDSILCGAHGALDLDAEDVPGQLRAARQDGDSIADFLRDVGRQTDAGDDRLSQLTYRERGVVRHIVLGRTNREIGEELGLAEKTVRNYVSNVLNKLNLDNRTQLAVQLARLMDEDGG